MGLFSFLIFLTFIRILIYKINVLLIDYRWALLQLVIGRERCSVRVVILFTEVFYGFRFVERVM